MLKLNPMPLAVVVSGFGMNEVVLARLLVLLSRDFTPDSFRALPRAAGVVFCDDPKAKLLMFGDGKLIEGAVVVGAAENEEVSPSVGAEVSFEFPKLKPPEIFGGSLLPNKPELAIDDKDGAAVTAGTMLDVDTTACAGAVTSAGFTGVKVIRDLFGSTGAMDLGVDSAGELKSASGAVFADVVKAGATDVIVDDVEATPNWKLVKALGASLALVVMKVTEGVEAGALVDTGATTSEFLAAGARSELAVLMESGEFVTSAGVVIGAIVLDVVVVVKLMEAGADETGASTESFGGCSLESRSPLSPDSINDNFSFSTERKSTSWTCDFSRGFTKLIFGSPSSSSLRLIVRVFAVLASNLTLNR